MISIPTNLVALIIDLGAAFIIWFFIYGRRALISKDLHIRIISTFIIPAILAIITAFVITFDFYHALMGLEQYGNAPYLHMLFIPVSALITFFIMIPSAKNNSEEEAVVPELPAIISPVLLMLTINFLCISFIHDNTYISAALSYLTTGILCCVVIICTPLISQDRYNRGLRKINDQLSDSRNAHYEAIKQSNFEIRRARHDMRNHLLVIRDLAQKSRREELLSYIDSISEQIEAAQPPYRSGNDIADAIIADKNAKANKRGLKLSISGDLSGLMMEPSDVVTILSNLLDNAIEAVNRLYGKDLSEGEKTINLEFRKNCNFLFILERNISDKPLSASGIISSKRSPDHGFGIYNIRNTVRKYNGEFNINCQETGSLYRVETEVILPMSEKVNNK